MCWSTGREPIAQPPGSDTVASPKRASSGPSTRIDARIVFTSSYGADKLCNFAADNPTPNPRLDNRLKEIDSKLEVPPLKDELRRFVDWVSTYTLSPRGMVLRMGLRMGEHLGPARERIGVRLAGPTPKRSTPARQRVLLLMADGLSRGKSETARPHEFLSPKMLTKPR